MRKPYERYKESGLEWISDIPASWDFGKLKFNANLKISTVDRHELSDEVSVTVCHYPQAYNNEKINKETVLSSGTCSVKEFENFKLKKGQIIITKDSETSDDIGVPSYVEEDIPNAVCGYHLAMIETNENCIQSSFLFRFLQSKNVNSYFDTKSNGVTRFGLGKPAMENLPIPIPSIEEQIKIVQYLDHQTAIIDQLVQQKEKLIELLKEKRQAVINEVVTKGLNPNEKMKDSGIEWLGEVPLNWNVIKLRYLCKITTGARDTENREDDGEYPFFVRSQTIERISTSSFDGEAILTAGDGVGVCKVWHYIVGKFDFHQRVYMMYDFKGIKGKYLFYYMKENFINDVLKLSAKSTVDSLRRPMFLDFKVLVPPSIEEQNSIVEYVEKFEKNIVLLIDDEQTAIEKLKEYRQSIISEAVTGKIDVRDWQPNKKQVA